MTYEVLSMIVEATPIGPANLLPEPSPIPTVYFYIANYDVHWLVQLLALFSFIATVASFAYLCEITRRVQK